MPRRTFIRLLLLSTFGCGEAPPPDRQPPPPTASAPDAAVPAGDAPALPNAARAPTLGFAARASGGIVAFDLATGSAQSQLDLPGVIVDLHHDRARRLLLVVERHVEQDASHVVALRYEHGLEPVARSPWLTGQVRVYAIPSAIVAVALEMSPSWWLLDEQLAPMRSSQSSFLPEGWVSHGRAPSWLALDTTRFENGSAWDVLWSVQVDSAVVPVERRLLPAPGRPESRLAKSPDRLIVARKHETSASVELLSLSAVGLDQPIWAREAVLPAALGSLESAVVDPSRDRVLMLLSRPLRSGVLADAPLAGGSARVWRLGGRVERDGWLTDNAVVFPGGAWVAHSHGATRFHRSGSELARGETLAELRPPLVTD